MPRSVESITNPVASPKAAPATATPSHEIAYPVTQPATSKNSFECWLGGADPNRQAPMRQVDLWRQLPTFCSREEDSCSRFSVSGLPLGAGSVMGFPAAIFSRWEAWHSGESA